MFETASRRKRIAIAIFICLGVLLGALQIHPHLGVFIDDAEFLVLGDALANGQGYTWANDPLQPPHNKYPPGYPLAVAGVLALTGTAGDAYTGIIPVKLLTLLAFAASLVLLWLLLARAHRTTGLEPVFAVGLFAVNPFVLEYAVQIMSELPYTLLSLLALWAAMRFGPQALHSHPRAPRTQADSRAAEGSRAGQDLSPSPGDSHAAAAGSGAPAAEDSRVANRQSTWSGLLLIAIFAALCYYARGIGATVALSVALWLLIHRQARAALLVFGVNAVLIGLWQVRNAIHLPVNIYSYQFFLKDQENFDAGTIGLTDLLVRVADNMAHYVLAGFLDVDRPALSLIVGAAAAAGWLVAAVGWGVQLQRQRALMAIYTFVYLGVIFTWPYASGRFLIPVIPFLGYYALCGGRMILARVVQPRLAQATLVAGAAALIGLLILANVAIIRTNLERWSADPAQYYQFDPQWASFIQSAQWLRGNTDREDVIMARRHFAMYVYSNRLTAKYRYDTDDYEMAYLLSGTATKYVVEDAFAGARGDFSLLPPALEDRRGGLDLVYATSGEPQVRVWRLVRPPASTARIMAPPPN